MTAISTRPIGLLIVATLLLTLGGCASRKATPEQQEDDAFADVKAEVQSAVEDPARADEVVALITELEVNFDASRIEISSRKENLRALNVDYDSSRADFEREFAAIRQEMQSIDAYFLRISGNIRQLLTEQEQKQINKSKNKYVASAIRSLRAI